MTKKAAAQIAGSVFLIWLVGAFLPAIVSSDWSVRGQFGDQFGAVNALFSGLAFAGVIYAVLLQRQELELQRRELELTREELRRAAEAQDRSQKALADQAAAAARSVEIIHRQWRESRRATLVPIQICLDAALATTSAMVARLQEVRSQEGRGFGSITLDSPSLSDASNRARGISRELFTAVETANEKLKSAVQISNRQVDSRRPYDSWHEAVEIVESARADLAVASEIVARLVDEIDKS
jgi:hypothetical protein